MKDLDPIQDIKKILVLRPDGIGDVLNSTPAILALREAYPEAHLSVVVSPAGAEVLSLNPSVDEILIYDTGGLHRSLAAKLRFIKKLRADRYDAVVIMRNSSMCNLIAYLSGARYRIGRKSERKRFSFTLTHGVRSRDPKGTKHESDRSMDLVRLIGAESEDRELILYLSEEERAWAGDFLHRQSIEVSDGSPPIVGIHPGGSSFDKLWPAENFGEVANRLIQKFGAKIMLFGGPGEDNLIQTIQKTMKHTPIHATGIRLRQFAALVEKCSLFLCNDSGPMHMAAALGVPTAAIFGPTDHVRWKPLNKKAVIVRRDMDCWPCSAHRCKREFECIKSLPVNDVLDAGCRILDA